ncbi:AAA family ATPase [bacterium]|nr:AAA family ATPase [bacterium]
MQAPAPIQDRIAALSPKLQELLAGLNQVLLGQEELTRQLVVGILAGGHILLEGLPGLGKTELVKGLARLCRIAGSRVQFTPDLLPSDITGSFLLQQTDDGRQFVFQQGPIFTNILLADEINRASPKTQSALLEGMAERSVTVMGETHRLPHPFFVVATQNPIELEGTYPLPEAQVDRFLFKIGIGRPGERVLAEIVRNRVTGAPPELAPVLEASELCETIALAREIHVSEPVAAYIARLVEASHPDSPTAPEKVRRYVRYGCSPRAAIALGAAARARALLSGQSQAGFDGVAALVHPVMNHRIILDYTARIDGVSVEAVLSELVSSVDQYGKPLPAGVKS